jgi:hypothetical protein
VRGKRPEKVPDEFAVIKRLGQYLLRKDVIPIHSEDLRPILLRNRGGKTQQMRCNYEGWFTQDGYPVLDGNQVDYFKSKFEEGASIKRLCEAFDMMLPVGSEQAFQPSKTSEDERRFCTIAYVISEKSFPYKNKTKYANKMVLDINGFFTEEMLWPPKDKDSAELGYKKMPVLASFYLSSRGVQLGNVHPLLTKADMDKYDMA